MKKIIYVNRVSGKQFNTREHFREHLLLTRIRNREVRNAAKRAGLRLSDIKTWYESPDLDSLCGWVEGNHRLLILNFYKYYQKESIEIPKSEISVSFSIKSLRFIPKQNCLCGEWTLIINGKGFPYSNHQYSSRLFVGTNFHTSNAVPSVEYFKDEKSTSRCRKTFHGHVTLNMTEWPELGRTTRNRQLLHILKHGDMQPFYLLCNSQQLKHENT